MPGSNKPPRGLTLVVSCGIAALALALFSLAGAAHPVPVGVTWTGTVARTLERRCVSCHGGDGSARPRLDDYESARSQAQAIKKAVLARHMPQWQATGGFGEFANDPSLTPHETELLAQWADSLAPRGDGPPLMGNGLGASPATAGPPDVMLSVPPGHGNVAGSRTVRVDTGTTDRRWIRGWTFLPGDPSQTAAALIALDSGTTLGTWVTGERATFLPDGVAQRLPAGAALQLTIYYAKRGAPDVGGRVGLYFAERPARELAHLTLPCGPTRVPQSIDVLAIRPAARSAAWSLAAIARQPGGRVEPLGQFQQVPATHARTYWFRQPVALPRGTSIDVGATHGGCGVELDYVAAPSPAGRRDSQAAVEIPPATGGGTGPRTVTAEQPAGDGGGYWCPMHAAVRASSPGTCPQCGMGLVPVTPAVEGPYALEVGWEPDTATTGTLRLMVRAPGTGAVVRDFEEVHERPFHLFLVSDDLREFSHVHPVAQPDGSLVLAPLTLASGPYQLFADFLPVGGTPQLIRKTIPARLPSSFSGSRTPHLVPDMQARTDAKLHVRLDTEGAALTAGTTGLVAFHLEDAVSRAPISDLEPYLGAWGHAFIVSADLRDAVHSHPLTPLSSPGGPTVYFQQRFPRPGKYRMWVQFQRGGVLSTVPFTLDVIEGRPVG